MPYYYRVTWKEGVSMLNNNPINFKTNMRFLSLLKEFGLIFPVDFTS